MSSIIDDFVRRYVREQDFHARVAELCGRRLERVLREANIRAITTWRVKRPDRLLKKLQEREQRRQAAAKQMYANDGDIYDDVPDLAGARVALYFPSERKQVAELIAEHFLGLRAPKRFPVADAELDEDAAARRKNKRFPGYFAEHFRVRLKETELSSDEKRFADGRCEIQVASVLMHAWAEVEHDLEYKTLSGPVSAAESALLDQINGLVMSGEIALEQLRTATYARSAGGGAHGSRLRDQYDLANWIQSVGAEWRTQQGTPASFSVGRADVAFRFLELLDMLGPPVLADLRRQLLAALPMASADMPLSELLIELLLDEQPEREATLRRARADVTAAESVTAAPTDSGALLNELAVGKFLTRWRVLEGAAMALQDKESPGGITRGPIDVRTLAKFVDSVSVRELNRLRHLRVRAIHGTSDAPPAEQLLEAANDVETILDSLSRSSPEVGNAIVEAMKNAGIQFDRPRKSSGIVVDAGPAALTEVGQILIPVSVGNRSAKIETLQSVTLRVHDRLYHLSEPRTDIAAAAPVLLPGAECRIEPNSEVVVIACFGTGVGDDVQRVVRAEKPMQMTIAFASGPVVANVTVGRAIVSGRVKSGF
jgi:ppGpp synthetase/RelA/SpoT-type nucleotidyltranferase